VVSNLTTTKITNHIPGPERRLSGLPTVPYRRVGDRSVHRNSRFVLTVASVTEDLI